MKFTSMMFLTTAYFCTIFNVIVTQIYVPAQTVVYNAYETKYAPQYTNYKPKDYAFEYGVVDPRTGDHKSQWEKRENGVTVGMYSLLEPDGSKRIVEYIADSLHGFRALVKKIPLSPHHQPVVYKAGYGSTPVESEKDNVNVKNEDEDTHEAIVLKQDGANNEDDETEYEKQEEEEEGPINKETEEVDTHKKENEEESEDYTDGTHEDEKNEDDEESSSYSSFRPFDEDEVDE